MTIARRRAARLFTFFVALASAVPASAQTPPAPSAPADAATLEQAKTLFQQGNELRKAGDFQRALEYYVRSRALVASVPNTLNAAFCLDQLGRYDEALELYEELLTRFRDSLSAEDRQSIAPEMATLRRKVGSIDVSANTDGTLVIDGRTRGRLPLVAPVRVLPGKHVLRVLKDGWETFETTVDVALGSTATVDAKLKPLTNAGRLRIDDPRLAGGDVTIDGAVVGQVPWEGTLAPGAHVFTIRKGELGTAPKAATVVAGQTVSASAEAAPLGAELRVVVRPPTAQLTIDDVPVGEGRWQGALPLGRHTIEAHEEGYVAASNTVEVTRERGAEVKLELAVDEKHPRWSAGRKAGTFALELAGGVALAPTFASGAESSCANATTCNDPLALGPVGIARGRYELASGLFVELGAGYLQASKTLSRTLGDSFTSNTTTPPTNVATTYALTDALRYSGPLAVVGGGYKLALGTTWSLAGAVDVGAVLARSRDDVGGTVSGGGRTLDARVVGTRDPISSVSILVAPELRLRAAVAEHVELGVGVAAALFLVSGPNRDTGEVRPVGGDCTVNPSAVDCAPGRNLVAGERSHGTFVAVLPTAAAAYRF